METKETEYSQRLRKKEIRLGIATMLWVVTLAAATFGPLLLWDKHLLLTVLSIGVNAIMGLIMIIRYREFLLTLDDLQRKIQFEAMALSLGVGIVGGLTYSLFDITNLISFDAEIGHLVMLMGLTQLVASLVARKKYS